MTGYKIYWNGGSGASYSLKQTVASNGNLGSTLIGLISGATYLVKVSAVNAFGEGPLSSSITLVAATAPSQMNPVTITQTSTTIRVAFSAPSSNGSPI